MKKSCIDGLFFIAGEQSNQDLRFRVGIAPANEFALVVEQIDDITRLEWAFDLSHFIGKNPGMAGFNPPAYFLLEVNNCHGRKGKRR